MCGRFTLTARPEALNRMFSLFDGLDLEPQFNVAPSQNVLAVRLKPGTDQPEAVRLRWGLIPSWADDIKIAYKLINARLDTAPVKPSFRSAFKHRHCLILADGFYEWKKSGKTKQPFHIRMLDGRPFGFAGLWEKWEHEGQVIESCTILTTEANATVRPVHERMPVIVEPGRYRDWLRTQEQRVAAGSSAGQGWDYLGPYPAELMTTVEVSPLVNNPRNNLPECMVAMAGFSIDVNDSSATIR